MAGCGLRDNESAAPAPSAPTQQGAGGDQAQQTASEPMPSTGTVLLDASVMTADAAADDDAGAPPVGGRGAAAAAGAAGSAGVGPRASAAGSAGDSNGTSAECRADLDTASPPKSLEVSGALLLSDPAIIEADGTFYAFGTGPGIPVRTSTDLLSWQDAGQVFLFHPSWVQLQVDNVPELWSPDISFFGGLYHLYYAASTQGSNRSCIGHATAQSLPGPFEDQGSVLCSNVSSAQADDWNAIHPNYVQDAAGQPYLAFGSFWSGLKLVALDPETGKPRDQKLIDIAARTEQGGAIEAPFIVRRCDYFYLFVSFDRCCDGVNSTYRILVGRSQQLTGPYVDRDGKALLQGGGTELVVGDDTWHGPGHVAIFRDGDRWYEAHHAYYAGAAGTFLRQGAAYLRISELMWDEQGWPASGGP
jgi:arabinan endo-1,5-alpha-L-arabinosidase